MDNTLRNFARDVYHYWLKLVYKAKLRGYLMRVPKRVKTLRTKDSIKVLFVVSEVASWKSELLYQAMVPHPRFNPVIGISTSRAPSGMKPSLEDYLNSKGYHYYDLDQNSNSIDQIAPDIIIYYKPYEVCYSPGHFYDKHLKYVFCGMDYCFSITKHAVHIEKAYFDYCWLFFTEHTDIAKRRKEILGWRANNVRVTGVPMQDILMLPKERFEDPWKDKSGKKRIIYAPHHSIKGTNGAGVEFATFLEFGEPILDFAKKYADSITIAFKPHPNLYMKLLDIWGKEKTDAYYKEWETLANTQLETGEYVGLFKYSDAIIHDSASFIVEYLYMDNPSMYLVAETNDIDQMFDFVQAGYRCYEHGTSVGEIEQFIKNVLSGKDNNKEKRRQFITEHISLPGGLTACENIINEILGH